jgi:uroporphyrinogen III methyltransferase/synthase
MERPLSGRRIAVTRARTQARELGERLAGEGAEVVYCPAIRFAEPANAQPFEDAVRALDSYDWLVLTSTNGVRVFFEELTRAGGRALPNGLRVACVGSATAAALRERGAEPAAVPDEYTGAEVARAIAGTVNPGTRVLIVRAAGGGYELPELLRALGAEVTDVESYQSVPDLANLGELRRELEAGRIDLITFTSPSTAAFLVEGLGTVPTGVGFAAIGPVTAARMHELGMEPSLVAPEHSIPGLVAAIVSYFASGNTEKGIR